MEQEYDYEDAQDGVPPDVGRLQVPANIQVPQDQDVVSLAGTVASIGSAAMFGHCTRRTLLDIEQDEVVVRKGDCGVSGTKTYVTNHAADTQSLTIKFLGSWHLQSKNANGENLQKHKHIQDEFISNLEVVKKFKEQVHQYDMRTPLQVPVNYYDVVGEDAWEGQWDARNSNREIVDLTVHWGKLLWTTSSSISLISTAMLRQRTMLAVSG